MKILLCSIGTRGDIAPFLALGDLLEKRGHQVHYAFPEQFASLVPNPDCFHPLSPRFLALIESREGKIVMGGKANLLARIRALFHLYQQGKSVNKRLVRQQYEITRALQPDRIIHNSKCSYPTLWSLDSGRPAIMISLVPNFMYYVEGHAHVGFRKNMGSWLNRLTYRLANFGMVKTIRDAQNDLPEQKRFAADEIRAALFSAKLLFAISPCLFHRPAAWPPHVEVIGYQEKRQHSYSQVEEALPEFLEQHQKVLLLTFGSMVNEDPEGLSHLLYSVLRSLEIPTIVNTASGGLMALEEYLEDPLFCFVKSVPYDWIMPRIYAVVHHGGAGTTHLGLLHACATLILPHIMDQFSWNALVHQLGAGPKGVALGKLDNLKLHSLLQDLLLNPRYKNKALQLSEQMEKETDHKRLISFLTDAS